MIICLIIHREKFAGAPDSLLPPRLPFWGFPENDKKENQINTIITHLIAII